MRYAKRNTLLLSLLVVSMMKAQLVFKDGGLMKIHNGTAVNNIFVVLNDPPAVPITTTGSGTNGIIMEAEYNRLKYKLETGTTAITVPYVSSNLEEFPVTLSNITAGTGAGSILFSTVRPDDRANGWDNEAIMPTDVANMEGGVPSEANNSDYVYDRFYIIDAEDYTAKPDVDIEFTYINAEAAANGGNSVTAANMLAQRWDEDAATWNTFMPSGTNTAGASTGTVSSVTVPSADFFRTWTLVEFSQPLPVQLQEFKAECRDQFVTIKWSSSVEKNTSFYAIEKSFNGKDFFRLAVVAAKGEAASYSYTDDADNAGTAYYRLSETDNSANTKEFNALPVEPCQAFKNESAVVFTDAAGNQNLNLVLATEQSLSINFYDMLGNLVYTENLRANEGRNQLKLNKDFADGVYLMDVKTSTKRINHKFVVEK